MSLEPAAAAANGFPRFFTIAGHPVSAHKVFVCLGIYVGTLATAVLAGTSGLSPLGIGLASAVCALIGLIGARVYHLIVHAPLYLRRRSVGDLWDTSNGGASLFGTLFTIVPASLAAAYWLEVPAAFLWDHMAIGVLAGGFWMRLGCVFNGCCGGRPTAAKIGMRLHNVRGVHKSRIPVQFLEMAAWLIGLIAFLLLWPSALRPGSYALSVLAWYGLARFFMEPLREQPDTVFGWRINQIVAVLLVVLTSGALVMRG
jgi:phosphatidylglycerol:prolipoprotein diacylglycerol transferase